MSDIVAVTPDTFISEFMRLPDAEKKADLFEKLLDMRNKELERQAKRDFDANFAKLRAELEPIQRSKENTFLKSKYAPLEAMQEICDPIIAKHGFAYSWREEDLPEGRKCILMDITGYGHTRTNSWVAPAYDGVKNRDGREVTNALQSAGIQSSYGERRTFKQGFGIVTVDEDTDGDFRTVKINEELQAELDAIAEAKNADELMPVYQSAYGKHKEDPDKRRIIIGAYNEAKQRLIGKPNDAGK